MLYANLLDKTPEQLRGMARACYKSASDSFDRSDTDGYLSQWASEQTARVYNFAAGLAENNWYSDEIALFDLDGNLVSTDLVETKYGAAWLIKNSDGSVKWVNPSYARKAATRRANLEKKGYRHGVIRRRVIVATGGSKGSYAISVYTVPDKDHPEIEIVNPDSPGQDFD